MSAAPKLAPVTPLHPQAEPQRWLSPEEVCDIVPGMTVRNLRELRAKRQGPRFSKPSAKVVVYGEADVHAWLAAKIQTTREQS